MANMRGGSRAGGSTVLTRDNLMRFLLMVDGPGSTLDADTLDGLHAKDFASSGHNHDDIYLKLIGGTMRGPIEFTNDKWWFADGLYGLNLNNSDIIGLNAIVFRDDTNDGKEGMFFAKTGKANTRNLGDYDRVFALDGKLYLNDDWVLTNVMMGHGNGIDADKVDGRHASEFLLLTGGTMTGSIIMNNSEISLSSDNKGLNFYGGARIYKKEGLGLRIKPHNDALGIVIANALDEDILTIKNSEFHYKTHKIWHKGNQGTGTGMDSDMVDGKHASDFATSGHNHDDMYLKLIGGTMKGAIEFQPNKNWFSNGNCVMHLHNSDITGINALIFENTMDNLTTEGIFFPKAGKDNTSKLPTDYDNIYARDGKLYLNSNWALTNAMMGHGNGIDSDKLDGLHAESFFRTDKANSYNLAFNSNDGLGIKFYNSDVYKIYMSAVNNTTWGGRAPGETLSDYNMYFRMTDSGGNRGFVFTNGTTATAGINNQGHLFLKKGVTGGDNKFTIDYNNDTESIDFTIN